MLRYCRSDLDLAHLLVDLLVNNRLPSFRVRRSALSDGLNVSADGGDPARADVDL